MHVLRDLRECAQRRVPELRRRIGAPSAPAAQAGRRFDEARRLAGASGIGKRGERCTRARARKYRRKMQNDPIVIIGAARTPIGGLQGDFATLSASDLGGVAIKAALERAGVEADTVDEAIIGCVLPAGQGQAPARQASLKAGLPLATGCTTVNKMCGSAMEAAMLAHDALVAGSADIIVAGGMESMTNAPYLLPKA